MLGSTNTPEIKVKSETGRQTQATVTGIATELTILKQKVFELTDGYQKMVGLVMTLQGRLEAINDARVRELQSRGHGPTG